MPRHPGLRETVQRGVGWHHAGLPSADRKIVEQLFRDRKIRVLVATTTLAVGLNLPASDVVVRDLTLGMTELSSASLLQMAGRAGRPGLQPEGRCYVLTPEREMARVQEMFEGGTLHSRLADDVATHINTEIALGIITTCQQLGDWYARTLHRQLADQPVDPSAALQWLLDNNLVNEAGGVLTATSLGIATSALMLRVASAAALEQFLAERTQRTPDPDRLEEELLFAVCGRPTELDSLVTRKVDEEELQRIVHGDHRLSDWALGRVRHLVGAIAVLTGADPSAMALDDAASLTGQVQRDLPRFLRFLARRADERSPGSPDIVVAATDVAAALEARIAERGCGRLLEAIKFGYPADENRRSKTVAEYGRVRAAGATTLATIVSEVNERARQVVEALPRVDLALGVRDGEVVGSVGQSRRPVRVHARLASERRERVLRLDSADPRDVDLGDIGDLASAGQVDAVVEVVLTGSGQQAWVYGCGGVTAEVAKTGHNIDARIDAILAQAAAQTNYVTAKKRGFFARAIAHVTGSNALDELQEQVESPPEAIWHAAAELAVTLDNASARVAATERVVCRREVCLAVGSPRPIGIVAAARELTRAEGALLTAAMLRAMGIDAKLVWATIDDEASALCVWRADAGPWHPAPIWPARQVRVHGERVVDAGQDTAELGPLVGWEVIAAYTEVTPRILPRLRALISGRATVDTDVERPLCPACKSEMRMRRGPTGSFWGCSQYPTCRQTLPIGNPPDRQRVHAPQPPAAANSTAVHTQSVNGTPSHDHGLADLPF
jgi:hypothetical protein